MNMNRNNSYFKYVIIAAVLIIPFMYSFFYLKAYWNPYGKGNIDQLPVAIVNLDEGKKGQDLIDQIEEKNTLKLSIVDEDKATDGLYDKRYYAVITIPKDFSSSMESISTNHKKHPTITYSPNQKSNYLASQIIDKVVSTVEQNLDNAINSQIVSSLSEHLNSVPSQMNTISDGFEQLNNGTKQLVSGSQQLQSGTGSLNSSYQQFNDGLSQIQTGASNLTSSMKTLNDGIHELATKTEQLNTLKNNLPILTGTISTLSSGSDQFTSSFNDYVEGVNQSLRYEQELVTKVIKMYDDAGYPKDQLYYECKALLEKDSTTNLNQLEILTKSGEKISSVNSSINTGLKGLNNNTQNLAILPNQIDQLIDGVQKIQSGSNQITEGTITLGNGINTLFLNSVKIKSGISTLSTGSISLTSGAVMLNNSVSSAKSELITKINDTKEEVGKVESLSEYSKKPVQINKKVVNEISSYGTAFSPFFISIALWVGCLMMYIVLYYDKEARFKKLSIDNNNHLQRTICYHSLATLSAIILGILLQLLLDFNITNIFLYYISIILVANTFIAIIEFLIVNFKDVGKFIALILLVLQLAASGGTFPIETVTKGFRWLHNLLPMSYTINLLRESLVKIESSLLTRNLFIVISILVVFVLINVVCDIRYKNKIKKA